MPSPTNKLYRWWIDHLITFSLSVVFGTVVGIILTAGTNGNPFLVFLVAAKEEYRYNIGFCLLIFLIAFSLFSMLMLCNRVLEVYSDLIKKIGGCYYEDDPADDDRKAVQGKLYVELSRHIERAETSIRALFMASTADRTSALQNNEALNMARRKYFNGIERKIESKSSNFIYERIFQYAPDKITGDSDDAIMKSFVTQLDDPTHEHCKAVLNLHSRGQFSLCFTRVPTQRLTGFVIIDDKTLIVITGGVDSQARAYHAGAFFFERTKSDPLISEFIRRFEYLQTLGKTMNNDALHKSISQSVGSMKTEPLHGETTPFDY